jgi:hypothetical protein
MVAPKSSIATRSEMKVPKKAIGELDQARRHDQGPDCAHIN